MCVAILIGSLNMDDADVGRKRFDTVQFFVGGKW